MHVNLTKVQLRKEALELLTKIHSDFRFQINVNPTKIQQIVKFLIVKSNAF